MRKLILGAAFAAAAIAAPAAAQPGYEPRDEEIVRAIPAPGEIEAMGDVLARVTDALLDVRVGPLREAIEPGRRLSRREREETLGDLAERDDPYARERLHDEIRGTSVGLAVAADRLAVLAPRLRQALDGVSRDVEDAIDDARAARRDRQHGYDRRDDPYYRH